MPETWGKADESSAAVPRAVPFAPGDAELAEVVEAWPGLPEAVRRSVLETIRNANSGSAVTGGSGVAVSEAIPRDSAAA